MKRLLVGLALMAACAAVLAGPWEDGFTASKRGDYVTAMRLWRPLADQGNADLQNILGVMYRDGQGVTQDFVEAHKWYNLSAAHQIDAQKRDVTSKSRDEVAAKMTAAQIAEAQKLAREWKPKSGQTHQN